MRLDAKADVLEAMFPAPEAPKWLVGVTDKIQIANLFNDFFTNRTNLDRKTPKASKDPLSYIKKDHVVNLYLEPCDEDEVTRIISKLN